MITSAMPYSDRACSRLQDGLAASEYAVMLALIILAAISAIMALGIKMSNLFTSFSDRIR